MPELQQRPVRPLLCGQSNHVPWLPAWFGAMLVHDSARGA